jgi:hypothetical protein
VEERLISIIIHQNYEMSCNALQHEEGLYTIVLGIHRGSDPVLKSMDAQVPFTKYYSVYLCITLHVL